MMADSIEHVISYWIIWQKFQSPVLGGVAVLTHWLPFLLFSVQSGAFADRYDRRRVIQIAETMFALVSLAWAILFLTDTLEVWHAVVLLTLHGISGVLWTPASQVIIHEMVERDELPSAVRLLSTGRQLGLLFAPAVGGLLLFTLGPAYGLLLNVVFYLPLIIWIGLVPHGAGPRPGSNRGGWADVMKTIREIATIRVIASMILLGGAASLLVGNAYQPQMPEFAQDLGAGSKDRHDHNAPLLYSVLLTAEATGAFVGGLILESRGLLPPNPKSAMILALIWCFALMGFAMTTWYPLAVLFLVLCGFLSLSFYSMTQTLVQLHAPDHARGRVVGLYSMAAYGLRAFSGVTVGVVGAMIGVHWSLALSAMVLVTIVATLLALWQRPRQNG
jgi:MFS family permease